MENRVRSALEFCTHGFHEPAAGGAPVAGINVHMLAPETLRAVVGVAGTAYTKTALLAGEIFFSACKFPGQHISRSIS